MAESVRHQGLELPIIPNTLGTAAVHNSLAMEATQLPTLVLHQRNQHRCWSVPTPREPATVAPTATAEVAGPIAGASAEDWVGLVVDLPDGEVAVVRSVGGDGQGSVQIGKMQGAQPVFTDGPMKSVAVSDLVLTEAKRRDKVKILGGEHKGNTGQFQIADGPNAFIQTVDGEGVVEVDIKLLGKLAVD